MKSLKLYSLGLIMSSALMSQDLCPPAFVDALFYDEKIEKAKKDGLKNTFYHKIDVRNEEAIVNSFEKTNLKFDVIIDDSTHIFEDQIKIKPIYETFPGWKTSTNGIKNIEELPENAKKYIFAVEDFIGTKISSISTSPEREDTILIENPFEI